MRQLALSLVKIQTKTTEIIDHRKKIFAKTVIISIIASAKYLGLESEQKLIGGGVSACAVCDGCTQRPGKFGKCDGGGIQLLKRQLTC